MTLLAIDTSAEFCAACLYDAEHDQILSSQSNDIGRGHAEKLMPMIGSCLSSASLGFDHISQIAVTNGPGSFTGVRVGLAATRGFALSLGVPVITITTLEACIEEARINVPEQKIVAIIDARREEAYVQIESGAAFIAPYVEIATLLPEGNFNLCGSGAEKLNQVSGKNHKVVHSYSTGNIETIAKMAAKKKSDDSSLEPLYLRSADAKPQSGFTLARA